MSMTDAQTVRNDYRTSMICLDSYEGKQMSGKLCNPYYAEEKKFTSLVELLYLLDGLADTISYPVASTELRRFKAKDKLIVQSGELPLESYKAGVLGTFAVKIMFRQNASWQGSIRWMEEDIQEYFRSALEMILLIDNAMSSANPS